MTVDHLPTIAGLKPGAEKFPLMVVVAICYVCNAKCPACPYTRSSIRRSYRDAPLMKSSTFRKIADECGKHCAYVRISGGGEPLLHPHMIGLVEYAKRAGAKVGLITNGSKLTPNVTNKLLDAGIDAIEVSVDAADRDTYSYVRAGLDFDVLLGNVRCLIAKRNGQHSSTRVVASVVNQRAIEGKLDTTVAFWREIVDEVQVRKYLTWGIGDPSESGDAAPYIPDLPTRAPCPFPFERLNVDSRGKIEFCGFDIAGETDFGNVNETTIGEVWRGGKFNLWRQLLLEGRYEEIPVCRKCPDWKYRSWNYNYWSVLDKAEQARVERSRRA